MAPGLRRDQIREYEEQGFVIVRNLFSEGEVEQIADGVIRSVKRTDIEVRKKLYPAPATQFTVDGRYIEDPGLAYIAAHPFVVSAAESLLGGPVALSASVAYLKTPGARGTAGDYEGSHPTAHQDYKTYQQAGSSLNWLFSIAPLVDLDEEIGALAVSPGSFKFSRKVRAGRVWRVERSRADQIAAPEDTRLRRGDLLLMNMFTWHQAGPNLSQRERYGVYNKYRALNAPPASGPELFSRRAHEKIWCKGNSLLPHYGDCVIGNVRLLLERDGLFLFVRGQDGGWSLPGGSLPPEHRVSPQVNLVGPTQKIAAAMLGLEVPWMSYIGDFAEDGQLCRVFAHSLEDLSPLRADELQSEWLTVDQVGDLRTRGGYEKEAVALWMNPGYARGVGEAGRQAASKDRKEAPA